MSGFTLPWSLASRFQAARELRGGVSLALAYREALKAWCDGVERQQRGESAPEREEMLVNSNQEASNQEASTNETRGTATGYAENSQQGDFC